MPWTGDFVPSTNVQLNGKINAEFSTGSTLGAYRTSPQWRAWASDCTYTSLPLSGAITMGAFRNRSRSMYVPFTWAYATYYPYTGGGSGVNQWYISQPGDNSGTTTTNPPAATGSLAGWASSATVRGFCNYGYNPNGPTAVSFGTCTQLIPIINLNNTGNQIRQIIYHPTANQVMVKITISSGYTTPWPPASIGINAPRVYYGWPTTTSYITLSTVTEYYLATSAGDRTWTGIYNVSSFPGSITSCRLMIGQGININ